MARNFNPYSQSPYDSSAASDAYNVGAYGYMGSSTPQSIGNANAQPKGQRKAPSTFSDLTDLWANTLKSYMQPQGMAAPAPPPPHVTMPQQVTPPPPPLPGLRVTAPNVGGPITGPVGPDPITDPTQPPPVTTPPDTTPPPTTQPPPTSTVRLPPGGLRPGTPGDIDKGNAPGQKPGDGNNQGLSDWAWNTANDWYNKSQAKYGDAYSWLLEKPWVLDMYKQAVSMRGEENIDPVDWIHSQFPELNNPGYMRAGYDTWLQNPDGTPKGGYGYNDQNRPAQMTQDELQKANAAATPLQLGTGYIQQIKDGIANKSIDPKSLPNDQLLAAGYTQADIDKMRGSTSTTTPPATTTSTQPGGDILSQLQSLLGPQFNYEQDQLNRSMNQQAAVTGDMNAGGYRVKNAAANADLVNQQNARLSDYLATAQQNDLQRALQKYIADEQAKASMYGADQSLLGAKAGAGATVSAAGIRSNADLQMAKWQNALQRYLGDQNYDLGVQGLNANVYNTDVNDRYRWAALMWMMSPEARLAGALPFQLPGNVGT